MREKRSPKRQTQTKILSLNIRNFLEILRFVAIYALFGRFWAKNCPKKILQVIFALAEKLPSFATLCTYKGKPLLQKFHFIFCPGNEELPARPVVVSDAHQQHGEEAE